MEDTPQETDFISVARIPGSLRARFLMCWGVRMSCSLISLVSPTLKQPEATATFGFETGHTSRQSEDGGITRRFVVNQTLQGPRVFIRSKATCAAPLCEVLTPCRGLRPHHVQKDRIGSWEISGLTGTA